MKKSSIQIYVIEVFSFLSWFSAKTLTIHRTARERKGPFLFLSTTSTSVCNFACLELYHVFLIEPLVTTRDPNLLLSLKLVLQKHSPKHSVQQIRKNPISSYYGEMLKSSHENKKALSVLS